MEAARGRLVTADQNTREDLALDLERIREAVGRLFELVETPESEVF